MQLGEKKKRNLFLLKVDFDKAFDSINWDYLESVIVQMGFGLRWLLWIRGYLRSARALVLINGPATKEFPLSKKVRQGDPLSPFIFIIAREGLNVAVKSAWQSGIFKDVDLPHDGPSLSHLFYADDASFFGDWISCNFSNLSRILRYFHAASCLKVNFHKSKVYGVGVSDGEIASCARILGCEVSSFPFNYLVVLVGANMAIRRNCAKCY